MAEHGFKVCVCNRSPAKVDVTVERAKEEGNISIVGEKSPGNFVARLKTPRKVVILVQAGAPVDETISNLSRFMEPGDIIIDGGNEWFPNSIRRAKNLETKGLQFIGMGISGGEEGARNGPSLMPGGPREAYDAVEPIFSKCAAQVERTGACVGYLGPVGTVRAEVDQTACLMAKTDFSCLIQSSCATGKLCQDGSQWHRVCRYATYCRGVRCHDYGVGHVERRDGRRI